MGYGATSEEVPKIVEQCSSNDDTHLDKALDNMSLIGKYGHIPKQSDRHIDKM